LSIRTRRGDSGPNRRTFMSKQANYEAELGSWSANSTDGDGYEITAVVIRDPENPTLWRLSRTKLNVIGESAGDFPEDYIHLEPLFMRSRRAAVQEGQDWINEQERTISGKRVRYDDEEA